MTEMIGFDPNALYKGRHPRAKTGLFKRNHSFCQITFRVEGSRTHIDVDHELIERRSD